MAVPKMVKNGVKSVFARLGSLWVCLVNAFWLCIGTETVYTIFGKSTYAEAMNSQSG
jgi:hypothetical protein